MRVVKLFGVWMAMGISALVIGNSGQGDLTQLECTVTVTPGQSIQQAIDQASDGAVICLSAGAWREHIWLHKGLTLQGAGPDKTRIQGPTLDDPVIRIEERPQVQAFEITIVGLTLTLQGAQIVGIDEDIDAGGLYIWSGGQITVRNVRITETARFGTAAHGAPHLTLEDLEISNNWVGLDVAGRAQAVILQSRIVKNAIGVTIGGSAQAALTGVQIAENELDGLVINDEAAVQIRESRFKNNLGCGLSVVSKKSRVEGTPNEMEGNAADLCAFAPAALRKPLVSPTQSLQLTVPVDYASLQQAIDALAPGGTIVVQAGTYQEALTFWKPVTLRGSGPKETILEALPKRQLIASVIAEAQDVTIEGLTMRRSEGVGLEVYGGATIRNVKLSDNRFVGLSLKHEARLHLFQSEISGSHVGLHLQDSAQAELSRVLISNNAQGIALISAAQARINDSTISGNTSWGINVSVSAQLGLFNSSVTDNGDDGLNVGGFQPKAWVVNSQIERNGTQEYCHQAGLEHHEICNGIELNGGAKLVLIDSLIRDNADWGIASWLEHCGYGADAFTGQVFLAGDNVIAENNRLGTPSQAGDLCLPPQPPPGCTLLATPQQSLQKLIDKAPEGAVICLQEGTWFENLRISQSLTLRGGLGNSFIKGREPDQPVILIQSVSPIQVILDGLAGYFSIQNARAGSKDSSCLELCPFGIVVQGPVEVVLKGIELAGHELGGLDVGGSASVRLKDVGFYENGWAAIRLRDSAHLYAEGLGIRDHWLGLFARDTAQATLAHSSIQYASAAGVLLAGAAHVRLEAVQIADHDQYGLKVTEEAELEARDTAISGGRVGAMASGSSWLALRNTTLSDYWETGVEVLGSATVIIRGSRITASGGPPSSCGYPRRLCNGIALDEQAQVLLIDTEVRGNADWGVAAFLKQCGYDDDRFSGKVIFAGTNNTIEENNKSANHTAQGNPGTHPFTNLPPGNVCLP